MLSSKDSDKPLLVLALGGNALSPPDAADTGYAEERRNIKRTGRLLRRLTDQFRLLVVHGNGPQVGRLLQADPGGTNLDIHIAQTQGELGYLLAAELPDSICVLTRVVVADELGPAVKPIGPVLTERPGDGSPVLSVGAGWRVVVASPQPLEIPETTVIGKLLKDHHVIAGGGGGIPIDGQGLPRAGVIDKDQTASLLARNLGAAALVFATAVDAVYTDFAGQHPVRHTELDTRQARSLIELGEAAPGSMAPKLASAADFVDASGRQAVICAMEDLVAGVTGDAGTRIVPGV